MVAMFHARDSCGDLQMSSSDSSLASDSDGYLPVRVRPLVFYQAFWIEQTLRPAGDFPCVVLYPSLFGLLGSFREGSRLLLFLSEADIAALLVTEHDLISCLRVHLALDS